MYSITRSTSGKYCSITNDICFHLFLSVGVIIFVTPLFDVVNVPSLHGVGGYLFCYLFDNTYVLFLLSKASVLIVMLPALERWCSVIRPFAYKLYFARKRLLKYVLCIFVSCAVVLIHKFFETEFKNNACVHVPSVNGEKGQQAFVLSYVVGTFLIPTLITWASFFHIWYRAKTSPSIFGMSEQARAQQKLLMRMCAITAAVLTGCWFPSQFIYILNKFGENCLNIFHVELDSKSLDLLCQQQRIQKWVFLRIFHLK